MSKQITFIVGPNKQLQTKSSEVTLQELISIGCMALQMVHEQGGISVEDLIATVTENLKSGRLTASNKTMDDIK